MDSREPKYILKTLNQFQKQVQTEILPTDYLIIGEQGRVAIQRKTDTDLIGSVKDGRLWDDLETLKDLEEQEGFIPELLIEGNFYKIQKFTKFPLTTLFSILHTVRKDWRINTPVVTGKFYTATYLASWDSFLCKPKNPRIPQLRPKEKLPTLKDKALFLLSGLPLISTVEAQRLWKHFGTSRKVFSATPEQLEEVEGIGKKKAELITQVLDYVYEENQN